MPLASIEERRRDVRPLIARTIGLFDGASARPAIPCRLRRRAVDAASSWTTSSTSWTRRRSSPSLFAPRRDSRVVVTSRAPLHLTGEHEFPVAPLGVGRALGTGTDADGGEDAARRLFVERARAVRPGWDPGPETAIVDEICRLVDGLPLGIELAAAQSLRSCRWPRSAIASRPTCHSRVRRRATRRRGSGPWRRRLPGATTSCRRRSSACSIGLRCSRAPSTSTRRGPVAAGGEDRPDLAVDVLDGSRRARRPEPRRARSRRRRHPVPPAPDDPLVRGRPARRRTATSSTSDGVTPRPSSPSRPRPRSTRRLGSAASGSPARPRTRRTSSGGCRWAIENQTMRASRQRLVAALVAVLAMQRPPRGRSGPGRAGDRDAQRHRGGRSSGCGPCRRPATSPTGRPIRRRRGSDTRNSSSWPRPLDDETGVVDAIFNLGHVAFIGNHDPKRRSPTWRTSSGDTATSATSEASPGQSGASPTS